MSSWSCHVRPARVELVRGVQVSFLGSARSPSTAHELRAGEKDGSRCPRGETVIHETAGFTWCAHHTTLLGMRPTHVHGLPYKLLLCCTSICCAQTCGLTSQLCSCARACPRRPKVRLPADFLALLASCCEIPEHMAYAAARAGC